MGKQPSEHYWEAHKANFPFQTEVPHRSPQDIDPVVVQKLVCFHFLRVPFDGVSHWGFLNQTDLDKFKRLLEAVV